MMLSIHLLLKLKLSAKAFVKIKAAWKQVDEIDPWFRDFPRFFSVRMERQAMLWKKK